jgi:hypothetical protein
VAQVVNAEEKRWRAQDDAHTLAQARVIQQDPERLAAAKAEAQRMAEEQLKQAAAMATVAKTGGKGQAPGRKPDSGSETQPSGGKYNVFKRL